MAGSRHCARAPGRRCHPVYCVSRRSVESHYNSVLHFCMSELSHSSRLAFQKHEGMNLAWDEMVLKVVLKKYFHSRRLSEENDFVKATGVSEITLQVKVPEIPAPMWWRERNRPLSYPLASTCALWYTHTVCTIPTYMERKESDDSQTTFWVLMLLLKNIKAWYVSVYFNPYIDTHICKLW